MHESLLVSGVLLPLICAGFGSGLAYKIILYFLERLKDTTTPENPAALRFRAVSVGLAPPVVVNTRTNVGFLRIPPHLKPLVQGNSTSFRCVCRTVLLHRSNAVRALFFLLARAVA